MSDKVFAVLSSIITKNMEESKTPAWHKPWYGHSKFRPMNLFNKKPFRGVNFLMTAMSSFSSPFYVTRKQADEHGYKLLPDQTYTPIVKWIIYEDKKTGESVFGGCRFFQEFNLTQFHEWEKIPLPFNDPLPERENFQITVAESVVSGYRSRPVIAEGDSAYYSPKTDHVVMPNISKFLTSEHYYSTLFHELAHSTGHESRLARKGTAEGMDGFGGKNYSMEELVAEMTACFICNRVGIDTTTVFDNSVAYLQGWLRKFKNDPSMLIIAAQAAQKAQDHILGTEWKKEDDEC